MSRHDEVCDVLCVSCLNFLKIKKRVLKNVFIYHCIHAKVLLNKNNAHKFMEHIPTQICGMIKTFL